MSFLPTSLASYLIIIKNVDWVPSWSHVGRSGVWYLLRLSWFSVENQVSRLFVQVFLLLVLGMPLFKAEDVSSKASRFRLQGLATEHHYLAYLFILSYESQWYASHSKVWVVQYNESWTIKGISQMWVITSQSMSHNMPHIKGKRKSYVQRKIYHMYVTCSIESKRSQKEKHI